MLFRILATLLALASSAASAAIFQVRGSVTESGTPVPGLSVAVSHAGGSTRTATTDASGFYRTTFNEPATAGDALSVIVSESGSQIGTGSGTYGGGAFVVIDVSVTTFPPTISSFSSAASIVNADSVLLVGTTSEPNRSVAVTRGTDSFSTTTDGSGAFELTVPLLQDAVNEFVATIADEFGKTVSSSFSITEDSTPPFATGLPGDITNRDVVLEVVGGEATLNGTSYISGTPITEDGEYALTVRDAIHTVTYPSFVIDKTPPSSPVLDPVPADINADRIVISASGDPVAIFRVSASASGVNAAPTFDANGRASVEVPLVQDAVNRITVFSMDRAGNSTDLVDILVREDSTPPVITNPVNSQEFLSGTTLVFSGGNGFLDGTSVSSGTFVSGIGSHTLRVRDAAGNETTVGFSVRSPNAPTISGLAIAVSGTSLVLSWTGSADSFEVFRDGQSLTYLFSTSYTDPSVKAGKTYSYKVTARRDGLEASAEASGRIPIPPDPAKPVETNVPAVAGEPFVLRVMAETGSKVTADVSGLNPTLGEVALSESSLGVFETSVDITGEPGSHSVPVTVTGSNGDSVTSTIAVVVETPDTPVSDVVLGDGDETVSIQPGGSLPVSVRGESGKPAKAELVNATTGIVVASASLTETTPGVFTGDVVVPEGTGDATLDLRVTVGNRVATAPGAVVVDGTPPPAPKVSGQSDLDSSDGSVEIIVENPDAESVSADVSGLNPTLTEPVVLEKDPNVAGRFRLVVSVDPSLSGERAITVTARDKAGNVSTSSQIVVLKTSAVAYTLSIPTGQISLVHLPLRVAGVERVSDLLTLLDGDVIARIAIGFVGGRFVAYVSDMGLDSSNNFRLEGRPVILNVGSKTNKKDVAITIRGTALNPEVVLRRGINLIGVPRQDPRIQTSHDLLRFLGDGFIVIPEEGGRFSANTLFGNGRVHGAEAEVRGGRGFIILARNDATVVFQGLPWQDAVKEGANANPAPSAIPTGRGVSQERLFALLNDFESGQKSFEEVEHALAGDAGTANQPTPLPQETRLLLNYPNPFNPETWIPFQLSLDADVSLTIYNLKGNIVRILDLGHLPAGSYTSRDKAAYWDGRNALGELVASGLYVVELRAGSRSFRARMMLLR